MPKLRIALGYIRPVAVFPALICSLLTMGACSSTPARKMSVFQAGDKATVDRLNYNVVDTQIFTRLGDDSAPRLPQNRFYVVQISVFNSGNEDAPIPALTLVDDSGKTFDELTDGTGVAHWLGVVRHVAPNQSETGSVVFDAPANHYKLKLTDDTDASDVFIDIPLTFAHERFSQGISESPDTGDTVAIPDAPPPPAPKKK